MPAIQLMTVSGTESTAAVEKTNATQLKLRGVQAAFSNYMQQTSSNNAQMARQQNGMPVEVSRPSGGNSSVQNDHWQYQGQASAQASKVSTADGKSVDTEGAGQAMEDAAEQIKDIIQSELGVDDEQLEAAMQLLGLTQLDLLDPQQLVALTAELTGSQDVGMLLLNGDLQVIMQEASVITDDLLQDLGLTMEQLMEQVKQQVSETPTTAQISDTPDMITSDMAETVVQEAPAKSQEGTADIQKDSMPQQGQAVQVQTTVQTEQEQVPEELREQPKENVQLQEVQKGQDTQAGQEGFNGQGSQQDTLSKNMQEEPRFDLNTGVHQGRTMDTPVVQDTTAQTPLPQVDVQDVIRQIVEYTRVSLAESVKTIEMQLNPENLGKVFLHVSEKQGAVTAQITAQNENIKEALIQQAAILKDSLNQQGIKVDAVEVSVGTHEFENNLEKDAHQQEEQARQQEEQGARRSRRQINLNDLDDLSGLMSEEETLVAQMMRDNGNKLDYRA